VPIDLVQLAKFLVGSNMIRSAINGLSNQPRIITKIKPGAKGMKITTHKVYSLEDRMKHVIEMAQKGRTDPRFRAHIASVLSRKCGTLASGQPRWCVPERDSIGEVRAIFNDFQRRARYTRDMDNVDTYQHPMRTLELGIMDCDDASIYLAAALMAAGYHVKFRVIRTKDSRDWNHIFILVEVSSGKSKPKWVALDGSVRKPAGWIPPQSIIAQQRDFPV